MFFSNLFLGLSQIWWIRKIRIHYIWETFRNKLKSIMLPKIVLTFYCLNKLFLWSQKCCKFSNNFFLTVGQNNFGNKIPILMSTVENCFNKISNWFLYFRHDADVMEESLNDEELAADAAITETFQKLVARVSMKSFNAVLEKLKRYAQNHILEPAVAGM